MAVRRVMVELKKFAEKPIDQNNVGLSMDPWMNQSNTDVTKLTAFIIGPEDSPYFGGFFAFSVNVPPNYPSQPPTIQITTTDGGKVRFNPNLYSAGKVCMDILNNHASNAWSPMMSLETILLSTQSLMKNDPYHNEPGFEDCAAGISPDGKTVRDPKAPCQPYSAKILHEVLRHAVCDQIEQDLLLPLWRDTARARFAQDVDKHIATCEKMAPLWDGKAFAIARFEGTGNEAKGTFDFAKIRERLIALKSGATAQPTATAAAAEPEPFSGPAVPDIDARISDAMAELAAATSPATREAYELVAATVAFALMEPPMFEPVGCALPPAAIELVKALGYEFSETPELSAWVLNSAKANKDAFEITQALLADVLG